jgi:hypothetical protein
MARFGQSFLASLTQPSYGQGLFELGGAIGQAPALAAERKAEQDRLARLDKSFEKTMQGTAAAQQGDVAAVTKRMRELQQAMTAASTAEEKQVYMQEIQALQRLLPGARQTQLTNKAKAIYTAEKALEDESLDPTVRTVLTERITEMKKDPDAVEQYNTYKINEWRTQKAQEQMENEAWLKSNGPSIATAIKNSDLDKLDSLGEQAAQQGVYEAFQGYVTTATQNVKTRDYLDERSTARTSKPNLNYQDAIDALPEELRSSVQARYDQYKAVSEAGWNEKKGEWKTGALARSKELEASLTDSLYRAQDAVAFGEYRQNQALVAARQEDIQKLELSLELPVDELNVARIARANAKDPEKITPAEYASAREEEKRRNRRSVINQIKIIDPEYAAKKYPDREITEDISMYSADEQGIIRDAAQQYRDKSIPDIISALKRKKYIGSKSSSDGAFGGRYMSSEYLEPEQQYLDRVRGKISPMGTYTQD